jgi:hypothetical protein
MTIGWFWSYLLIFVILKILMTLTNRCKYRLCSPDKMLFSLSFLALLVFSTVFMPVSRASELVTVRLQRHYTGDFTSDILLAGKPDKTRFDVNRPPARYQKNNDAPEPKPAAKQFIDKSKKKGISANGPEKLQPAFTGYFPGYPPESVLLFAVSTKTGLSDGENGAIRIRPPPIQV